MPRTYQLLPILLAGLLWGCDSKSVETRRPVDPLSVALEEFTENWTKVVWSQHQNPESSDTYASGKSHYLMGLDTRDGRGVRIILEEKSSYGRPMITPDGERIVYSYKDITRPDGKTKHFEITIYQVVWDGANRVKLGDGYAADVWRDPRTGIDWVYAARQIQPSQRASLFAEKIVRFQLDDPEKVELVWDRTVVSPDNFQLSGDGLRAGGLFPWPTAGAIDFSRGDWMKYGNGCWTSMAPDNSYVSWIFDGGHRVLNMFSDGGERSWGVDLSVAPGIDGNELYHPRWSNHVRFLAFTGPYKKAKPGENKISKGGVDAEVFLGKFSERLDELEGSLRLTENSLGDFYPDLWIAGGQEAEIDGGRLSGGRDDSGVAWPSDSAGLVFLWENRAKKNEVPEAAGTRICRLEPIGRARYFRDQEMDLGGGSFVADAPSVLALNGAVDGGDFSLEALVSPEGEADGPVIDCQAFVLSQR
ncbi:MAG: hypothetical protein ACC661_06275, partial [Verrucomicrobiales bacterium]